MAEDVAKSSAKINVPYMAAYGNITRALEKMIDAPTPDRFTQDFLSTKLGLKGGSPKPVIPYLKRTGFLNGDGTPTELYKEFRNNKLRGAAAARALRHGYAQFYEHNEFLHELDDKELKNVIIQATGLASTSRLIENILGSFKSLRAFADFNQQLSVTDAVEQDVGPNNGRAGHSNGEQENYLPNPVKPVDLKLGYTININLPSTSDISVYNSIFKSIKENLLQDE